MKNLVTRFVKDESGATAIEYGLIAAGISVAIIAVVQGLGSKLNTTFTSVRPRSNKRPGLTVYAKGSGRSPEPFRLRRRLSLRHYCIRPATGCSVAENFEIVIIPANSQKI